MVFDATFNKSLSMTCKTVAIYYFTPPVKWTVPSQGHYGFHSFPVVDWFCLFIYLWVLTFPLEDCSEFGNFVITLIRYHRKNVESCVTAQFTVYI